MRKFIKHVCLFFFPSISFIFAVGCFYFQVKDSGEFYSADECIEYQRENEKSLLGMGYYENTPYYKLTNVDYYKTPIIALGTSRVMQFKKVFFSSDFYNCGGAVAGNYNEYLNFLLNMKYNPECIILGLDSWVFNDGWNAGLPEYNEFVNINHGTLNKKIILKNMFDDWNAGKWKFKDLSNYPLNIGFNGKVKDAGFMHDGSYYYGNVYRNPINQVDYGFVDTRERIRKGVSRFEWGDRIDNDTVVQLENLLRYCKENNIYVIGFLAPFAPSIYDEMINSGNYGYLMEITPACEKMFNIYGYEYYDFLDVRDLGVTDDFFVDGFHGSEVVYGKMMLKMLSENSLIEKYSDVNKIENILESTYNGLVFYNPDYRY